MRQRSDCVPKHGSHLLTPQLPVEASSSSWSGGYLLLMFVICACLWCLQEDVGLGVRKREPQVGNDEILVPNVFDQADGEGSSSPTQKVGEEIRKVGFLDAEGEENSAVVDAEAEREGFLAWKRVEPDCKVTKEAALHTARRIKEAVVVMEPYPHVQVFGIFPERLYACIMQKMPAGDGAYSRTGKRTKRFVVDLYDRKLGKGSANRKWKGMNGKGGFDANFWKELGIVYANDDGIRDAWLDKFALTLGARHKNVTSIKSQIQTTMELNRDRAGYQIGPHTDSELKWVTTLYYLAKDLEHENTGTCVVRSKRGRLQTGTSDWLNWNDPDFEVAAQARYVPNSVFAFAPCFGSWHAVPKMTGKTFVRDTIQTFLMVAKSKVKSACPAAPAS